MSNQVFEGRAELNITSFLDGLKRLETEATSAANKIAQTFQALDQSINGSLNSVNQKFNAVANSINQAGQSLSSTAQRSQQASQSMAQSANAQAASSEKAANAALQLAKAQADGLKQSGDYAAASRILQDALQNNANASTLAKVRTQNYIDALKQLQAQSLATSNAASKSATNAYNEAVRLAQAQARGQTIAKDYAGAIKTLQDALEANKGNISAQQAQAVQNQILQAQQRQAAADKKAAEQAAAAAKAQADRLAQLDRLAAQQRRDQARLQFEQQLRDKQSQWDKEYEALRAHWDGQILMARERGSQYSETVKRGLAEQTQELERAIREQQEKQIKAQQVAQRQQMIAASGGNAGSANGVVTPSSVYTAAMQMAETAYRREANLRKQLTAVAQAEGRLMKQAIEQGYENEEAQAKALRGQMGFFAALRAGLEGVRSDLAAAESAWGSFYHAGAQLRSLGNTVSMFGGALAAVGLGLAKNSGDFDFWVHRTISATRAANEQFGAGVNSMKVTAEEFSDAILEAGRTVGILSPEEVAQSWFTYQAALGGVVETAEDLAQAQRNVELTLKASVTTATDAETVIRGVTSVLGEFKLGTDDFEYVLSVMAQVTQVTAAEMSDLLESFKMVGPQAERLGMDVADTAAIFALLADNGIRGSQAGRLFASGLTNLVNPTNKMNQSMQELLVTQRGLTGHWQEMVFQGGELNLSGFLREWTDATKDLNAAEMERYASIAFGKEAGKVWTTLVANYREDLLKLREAISELDVEPIKKPGEALNALLQDLLVTQQGLTGEWQKMVGDGSGGIDIEAFLGKLSKATKGLDETSKEAILSAIGGAEAVDKWRTALEAFEAGGSNFESIRESFKDSGAMADAFGEQWEEVAKSSKVQLGQLTYSFQELGQRLGTIVAVNLIPMLEVVRDIAESFMDWMKQHPETANGLVKVGIAIAAIALVAGPAIAIFGILTQAVAGVAMAGSALGSVFGAVKAAIAGINGAVGPVTRVFQLLQGALVGLRTAFGGLNVMLGIANTGMLSFVAPVLAVIAIIGLLYLAWTNNWGNIQEVMADVVPYIQHALGAIGLLLSGLATLLVGVFSGNKELIEQGGQEIAIALLAVFLVLPIRILNVLDGLFQDIWAWVMSVPGMLAEGAANWISSLTGGVVEGTTSLISAIADIIFTITNPFLALPAKAIIWGYNFIMGWINGGQTAFGSLYDMIYEAVEIIARFLRSFSPPRYGPLRHIAIWGKNLIGSFIDGMRSADLTAVSNIAGKIGDQFRKNIQVGNMDPSAYAQSAGMAHNLVDDMLGVVREGGRVTEDFFSELQSGLGEWHSYLVDIALAYQDVYANERQLEIEQKKLQALKDQREEINKANKAKQDAFDRELNGTDAASVEANKAAMVDPTTAEGQRKIAEMKASLSKEEYQNWINFQKQLWDKQAQAEDAALAAQEEQVQAEVNAINAQLQAAKAQYDYYVQIYEYAQKLYELAEEQRRLEEEAAKKNQEAIAKEPKLEDPFTNNAEEYNKYRDEIRGIVGEDQVIKDEVTLKTEAGGDDIRAYGDAADQEARERDRLAELDKVNRRKRAEFEVALTQAQSEEDKKRIQAEKDAWDAAYREEKARIQERIQDAKAVVEAAEKAADASKADRIAEQQAKFAEEIRQLLGDQSSEIADANALKAQSADYDEAEKKARAQLREEERALKDLRAEGDQRRLDFEKRIREASGDEEKIRRIKEEQEAWEVAYKTAIEAQEARVEAARRAQQDLADLKAEDEQGKQEKDLKQGGAGLGGGKLGIGDEENPIDKAVEEIKKKFNDWKEELFKSNPILQEAVQRLESLKRAFGYLFSEEFTLEEKLAQIGKALGTLFGWEKWEDLLWTPEQKEAFERAGERIKRGWDRIWSWFDKGEENDGGSSSWGSSINRWWNGDEVAMDASMASDSSTGIGQIEVGMKNRIGEFFKNIGDAITGGISAWFAQMGRGWQVIVDGVVGFFTAIGDFFVNWGATVAAGWGVVTEFFVGIYNGIIDFFANWGTLIATGWDVLTTTVSGWAISIGNWWDLVIVYLSSALQAFGPFLWDALQPMFAVWQFLWDTLIEYFSLVFGEDFGKNFREFFEGILGWFSDTFANLWDTDWQAVWDNTKKWFNDIWKAAWDGDWAAVWDGIKGWWAENFALVWDTDWATFWDGIKNWFSENFAKVMNTDWEKLWGDIKLWWSENFARLWNTDWEKLWNDIKLWWNESFAKLFNTDWDTFWGGIQTYFNDEVVIPFTKAWNDFWGELIKKWNDFWDPFKSQWADLVDGVKRILNPIADFVEQLKNIKFPRMPDWLRGGGPSSSGGGTDGTHATGLAYVPFDGYRAWLHQGERVLTAAENAAYSANQNQISNVLSSLAYAVNTANMTNSREVTINVDRIDATNPSEGRAFLRKVGQAL